MATVAHVGATQRDALDGSSGAVRFDRTCALPPGHDQPRMSAGRRSASTVQDRSACTAARISASVSPACGRCGSGEDFATSGLPVKIPSVPANTSASIEARGNARLTLRISGVVNSTSPSRRNATTSTRGASGNAIGFMVSPAKPVARQRNGVAQHGQTAQGAHAAAADHLIEPRLVCGKLRAVVRPVPQMQYAGREPAVFAPYAGMKETHDKV